MTNVIVLFPKIEDAKNIRNLLVRHGFRVSAVCTTGAQALASANGLGDGDSGLWVQVSGYDVHGVGRLPADPFRNAFDGVQEGLERMCRIWYYVCGDAIEGSGSAEYAGNDGKRALSVTEEAEGHAEGTL